MAAARTATKLEAICFNLIELLYELDVMNVKNYLVTWENRMIELEKELRKT